MIETPPILEFDPERQAILSPRGPKTSEPMPESCVLCFFQDVITQQFNEGNLRLIGNLGSEMGLNPLYLWEKEGKRVLVFHPGVGAPLCAGFLEEVIAIGARKFIACGGCGVLDDGIAVGHPVIIKNAVRDEGTSYHYLPPGREVAAHPVAVQVLEDVLKESGIEYLLGKSWTTDAFYRETPQRRASRTAQGCQIVEMEAAAFFAVAQFRGVIFGQIVYGGDLVVPEGWDLRGWHKRQDDRSMLFQFALQACLRL